MTKKISQIFLLLLLSSCVSKVGNPKTKDLYKANISNGLSLGEITKNYGNYSDSWQDEKGNNVYEYSFSRSKYDLVSELPIINHFGFIKSENYEVLLVADKNNLVIEKINFYNLAKSRNSLVCNPKIYSCLRKVY